MTIDPKDMARYRTTLHRRDEADRAARASRRQRAMAAARIGAELLRSQFGATHVVVFGSVVAAPTAYFDARSDVDLAATGIPDDKYFTAVAKLQDVSAEFSFDLVAMERCPDHLRSEIEAHGVSL